MNRKTFIKQASAASLALGLTPSLSPSMLKNKKIAKIGLGLFTAPRLFQEDVEKGIATLAELGIHEFETYGPYVFSDARNHASWKAITPQLGFDISGFLGLSLNEFHRLLKKYNISVPSMHTDLYTLEGSMGKLAEAANTLGANYVVLPAIPETERETLDDYKRIAERFNAIGAAAKKEGIAFAYHNHGYGLVPNEQGIKPVDLIFDGTDPNLVFLEMDIFWTVAGRANPVELIQKHSGRYKMFHLKDMSTLTYFEGEGSNAAEWMALFPKLVSAGSGVMPIDEIVQTATAHGAEHFFIEHDFAPDPIENIGSAARYLESLKW